MRPGRAFPAPLAAPSLAAGPLAAGSRARADPEGQAPAHSRPQAASQPGGEGSALYGPPAGRKCLVGPGEEAPYMARGGRGRAGGGEPARDGGRFRCRGPEPQGATPTPRPGLRARSLRRLATLSRAPLALTSHLHPQSPLCQSYRNRGSPAGHAVGDLTRLRRLTPLSWIPSSATYLLCDLEQNSFVSEPQIPPPRVMEIK